MDSSSFTDAEVLQLMRDGGVRLCDYAIEQWWSGKYRGNDEQQRAMVAEWEAKRTRIRELYRDLQQQQGG